MRRRVEKYRPPKPVNRVTDFHYRRGEWAPSLLYSHSLWDIQNQMTPAEHYREQLRKTGKQMRILQRLEWRWQKAFPLWLKCAVIVQAGYRGMIGRRYFRSVRNRLLQEKARRELKENVLSAFAEGRSEECLQLLTAPDAPELSNELRVIQGKIYYTMRDFDRCMEVARQIIAHDETNEDGYYLLACSHSVKKDYDEAYKHLKVHHTLHH